MPPCGTTYRAALPHLRQGAEVLVLTKAGGTAFTRQELHTTVLGDADLLEAVEARFDAVIIDGLLENEAWDRWLLQRLHRALRMDAPIVVVVPPLTSLASAFDLRFLRYVARRSVEHLMQLWRPGWEWPGPVRRRYDLPRLIRKMESLGYAAVEPGPGWPGSPGPAVPWLARRAILTARKAASMAGRQGRSWPDGQAHLRRYARQYAAICASRDAWLSAFPELRRLAPRALEPSKWREARALVLSPHPDDELIGCGGTLCRLVSAGAEVSILQATNGARLQSLRELPESRRKTVRSQEAGRVAACLGAGLVLWREEDGALRCTQARIAGLARLINEWRPTHVFTPFLGDRHVDHQALSAILAAALAVTGSQPRILQYEVWSLAPANLYCDISECVETLESLFMLYEQAMRVDDFVHFCGSRNLARGLQATGRHAYVEAFLSSSSTAYRALAVRSPP